MSTPIEIQGMTLSIDWYRDEHDNLIVKRVSNLGNSYEFLKENIQHFNLAKYIVTETEYENYLDWLEANEVINVDETILNFYQLSHYEQCELICEMLNYDDSLHHHFEDKCYRDKDTHFALKEDCYE